MIRLLRDIGEGIRSQPGRTGLSFLAIMLGSLTLAVLTAVLNGLAAKSQRMLREFGGQVVALLAPADNGGARAPSLTADTADLLARNLPEAVVSAARHYEAFAPGSTRPFAIVAADPNLARVRGWRMLQGRFLDTGDVQRRERHAVLSDGLSRGGFAHVGDWITLGGVRFQVIGVVDSSGTALVGAVDSPLVATGERVAYVPLTMIPVWLNERTEPGRAVDAVWIRLPDGAPFDRGRARIARLLAAPGWGAGGVTWVTPETILRGVRRLQRTIDLSVGSITLLTLLLGGITLMSLMVANVRERVTEIGLRRALGATPWDIAALFVVEACLLTLTAAAAGAAAAQWLLGRALAVPEIPLLLDARVWLVPLAAALVVGVLFSYIPARMAARISPAAALRSE